MMKDLPLTKRLGTLHIGSDVHTVPPPDANDPHWVIHPLNGKVDTWQPNYVFREDWEDRYTFYKSSAQFQKHKEDVRKRLTLVWQKNRHYLEAGAPKKFSTSLLANLPNGTC